MTKIDKLKNINGTDVMRQALIAHAEMIVQGASPGDQHPFAVDSEAVFARDESAMVVGFIIWRIYEGEPLDAWISLSWVAPHLRRTGLYRRMLFCLREECIERKLLRIESNVYTKNSSMQACKTELGFIPIRIAYRMDLPKPIGEVKA